MLVIAVSGSGLSGAACGSAAAANIPVDPVKWSRELAGAVIAKYPTCLPCDTTMTWNYEQGVILNALWRVWRATGDSAYFDYVRRSIDYYLADEGSIKTYDANLFRLDDVAPGRAVLDLYRSTREPRYKLAAERLRKQLLEQPRNKDGGFWHKKIYPHQMWLDGLYMAEPFYAMYAKTFDEPSVYRDIARQFILMARHARDPKTGLFYHGWDESRTQKWANPANGNSPTFWGRAMGWYVMGLVDVLDYLPEEQPERNELVTIFRNLSSSILRYQDKKTHLWWQVVDRGDAGGNYLESSASAMFAYAFAKGVNNGYLPARYLRAARAAFDWLVQYEIKMVNDYPVLLNTCAGTGLGGMPFRDGSFNYYVTVPRRDDDFRGLGPAIMSALEIEKASNADKVVYLDSYHNNEWVRSKQGKEIRYHYIWEDTANSGYSQLGKIIRSLGARINESREVISSRILAKASVYMIVDPDTRRETRHPHYIDNDEISALVGWVEKGGVLVIFANDSGNCEFEHLNKLAGQFGIGFNYDSRNDVVGKNYEMGAFASLPQKPMFENVRKIFLKEISTLTVHKPARSELVRDKDVIMASANYGKGLVFAVGDPWFYNEYIDNRKLPAGFDNYDAARSLFAWLLKKAKPVTHR